LSATAWTPAEALERPEMTRRRCLRAVPRPVNRRSTWPARGRVTVTDGAFATYEIVTTPGERVGADANTAPLGPKLEPPPPPAPPSW
jgi:hypothetical protein